MLAVVAEHARVELGVAGAAGRAGALGREHLHLADPCRRRGGFHRRGKPVQRRQQVHDALAEFERLRQQRTQLGLVVGADDDVAHRQLERVLLETVEPRPGVERQEFAVDAQVRVAARLGPLGEVGVDALAIHDQRREQADVLALVVAQQLRRDALGALRAHWRTVLDAMLHTELHVEQAQEVPDLRRRRDRALAPAARQALLDRDRRRNAVHRIDLRPSRRLDDAARIRVQRFEVAPLALVEQDVERQRALARAADAGDDAELAARNGDVERLQVVLARVDDANRFVGLAAALQHALQRQSLFRLRCPCSECS